MHFMFGRNKRLRRIFLYKRFILQRFDGVCHHFQVNKQSLKAKYSIKNDDNYHQNVIQ